MAQEYQRINQVFRQEDSHNDNLNEDLFEEIRVVYSEDIELTEQETSFDDQLLLGVTEDDEALASLSVAIDQLKKNAKDNDKSCGNCATKRRVETVLSLKKGQHIAMPGENFIKYSDARRRLKHAYTHHAIVKEIKSRQSTLVEMVLIHFTRIGGEELQVYETTEKFDLREKEIYIVDYIFPRYPPDKIVSRAESILNSPDRQQFKEYSLWKSNCEHFATWCVLGEGESFQVQGVKEKLKGFISAIFGDKSQITKTLIRLLLKSPDEIATGFGTAAVALNGVLVGTSAFYLIICIVQTIFHVKEHLNGQLCRSCLNGKLIDLWGSFGVFGLTSGLATLILYFALPLVAPAVGIPLSILLVLLSLVLQWSVSKIRNALRGPLTVDRQQVRCLSMVKVGDVICERFKRYSKIVTDITFNRDTPTKGSIQAVYYESSSIFSKRQIVESTFAVDLSKDKIFLYDCQPLKTFSTDVVLRRVRSRIGETKWSFSNRSEHLCYWAKVKGDEDDVEETQETNDIPASNKKLSSFFIEKKDIHLMEDLQVGDVVESSKIGNTGILVGINYLDRTNERIFQMKVCTYDLFWTVRLKTYEINLNKDRLYVKKYHPAQCHPMNTRARNAQKMIDQKGTCWTTSGFIEHCIHLK